jgi:hypothetical protein
MTRTWLLSVCLWLRRQPLMLLPTLTLSALLWIGAAYWLAQQHAQFTQLTTALQRPLLPASSSNIPLPASALEDMRWSELITALGDQQYLEQSMQAIFAAARKHGLVLAQGEYSFKASPGDAIATYSVRLPLKGQYAGLKAFTYQVLLNLPFASLDGLQFKRETALTGTVEAELRLTLHLRGSSTPASGATQ